MTVYGWQFLKMPGKWFKKTEMFENCQQMADWIQGYMYNCWNLQAGNSAKWLETAGNGRKWMRQAGHGWI